MHTDVLGRSPTGSNVCFQRHPRNICARMPKGNDSNIHVQSISSVITYRMVFQSSPRYIQYRIAPPKASGITIFNMILLSFITKCKVTKLL